MVIQILYKYTINNHRTLTEITAMNDAENNEPIVAQKSPYAVEVQEGVSYYWCTCGRSNMQPFCDGSHNGTSFEPLEYKAEKTGTVYFCGCKKSATQPLCDGTHNKL